jgi:hypothetical protein
MRLLPRLHHVATERMARPVGKQFHRFGSRQCINVSGLWA